MIPFMVILCSSVKSYNFIIVNFVVILIACRAGNRGRGTLMAPRTLARPHTQIRMVGKAYCTQILPSSKQAEFSN